MAETPLTNNPFLYSPRWNEMQIDSLDSFVKQILEERDRELEDYLGSQTSGGGTASALRRSSLQTFNVSDIIVINFSTTDYVNGATVTSYGGGSSLLIATAGVWDLKLWAAYGPTAGNDPLQLQLAVHRGASNAEGVTSNASAVNNTVYFENLTMEAALQVGDIVYGAVFVTGGGTCVGKIYGNLLPARLSASLVS